MLTMNRLSVMALTLLVAAGASAQTWGRDSKCDGGGGTLLVIMGGFRVTETGFDTIMVGYPRCCSGSSLTNGYDLGLGSVGCMCAAEPPYGCRVEPCNLEEEVDYVAQLCGPGPCSESLYVVGTPRFEPDAHNQDRVSIDFMVEYWNRGKPTTNPKANLFFDAANNLERVGYQTPLPYPAVDRAPFTASFDVPAGSYRRYEVAVRIEANICGTTSNSRVGDIENYYLGIRVCSDRSVRYQLVPIEGSPSFIAVC